MVQALVLLVLAGLWLLAKLFGATATNIDLIVALYIVGANVCFAISARK